MRLITNHMYKTQSKISRTPRYLIYNSTIAPPKKLGGGGDNNDGDDDKKRQESAKRLYQVNSLKRMYASEPKISVTRFQSELYQETRQPVNVTIVERDGVFNLKVELDDTETDMRKKFKEIRTVVEFLNSFNVGIQFLQYIKYDTRLKDLHKTTEVYIPLNIPVSGVRASEWDLRP